MTFKWQQGSVVVELDWPHLIARLPKPPISHQDLGDIFLQNRNYSLFVSNFIAMATRVGRGRISLTAFNDPTPETLL